MQKEMDYTVLSASPLFRGLSPMEVEGILQRIPYRVRRFPAGRMVAQGGEQVNAFMIILSGYVKGEMTDSMGRVIKIEDVPSPNAIAPAFMFGKNNKYPVNVSAVPDTELLIIDKIEFLRMLKENSTVLVNFLDMISNRSQFLTEKIKFLSFKTIKSKLAQYILDLSVNGQNEIRFDKSQSEIAEYFGVARPSVARAIGELEELGLIASRGKNIKLLNRKDLVSMTRD